MPTRHVAAGERREPVDGWNNATAGESRHVPAGPAWAGERARGRNPAELRRLSRTRRRPGIASGHIGYRGLVAGCLMALGLFAAMPLRADYSENFDTTSHWYKVSGSGGMYDWNDKGYTNDASVPLHDKFTADYAKRETNYVKSPPFAWRLGHGEHRFLYECTQIVHNFSLWLAREPDGITPEVVIRYSNNSGATWNNLYHGTTLFTGVVANVYTQYVSPTLNVSPRPNHEIYIQVYKLSGVSILIDDFELNHSPPETNTVFMVYPAPATTGMVADITEFFTDSLSNGDVQIGYGQTTNNVDWTWLDAGKTNAAVGFGATNSFWLMSGKWYYAARWIRDSGTVTNYAWNDHGQTNETTLDAAEYFWLVTNSVHSTIWDFGYANDTSPTQGTGSLTFAPGLVSNWPGDSILAVTNFPTGTTDKSKYLEFSTSTEGRQSVGFYFSVRRNANGPQKIDIKYTNTTSSAWQDFITNCPLPEAGSWFMVGGTNTAFDLKNTIGFRIIGYDATTTDGKLEFDEVQVHAPVPEPVSFVICYLSFIICHSRRRPDRTSVGAT